MICDMQQTGVFDGAWRHSTPSDQRLDHRYRDLRTLHERKLLHTQQVNDGLRRSLDYLRALIYFLQVQAESGLVHVIIFLEFLHDGTQECLDGGGGLFVYEALALEDTTF